MQMILPLLAAALLAPAAASAETVAPDPAARQVTALGGTIVWVSGQQPAKLMMRSADGTVSPVPGTGERAAYRNPDLGRDAKNRLVLTYSRCSTLTKCTYVRDDLRGNVAAFKGLAPKNCALAATPAVWRSSVAYALSCVKRVKGKRVSDDARSGLYLKKASKKGTRFSVPREPRRAGSTMVSDVDLRGGQIAAVYADIYAYAVVQSTTGGRRAVERVAVTEGDGDQHAAGVTIGTGEARMWSLTRSYYGGEPAQTIIHRRTKDCGDYEVLTAPAGPDASDDYPYVDLAVDSGVLYAVDPGVGVVTHGYAPAAGC